MTGFDVNKVKVSCSNCNLSELCIPAGLDQESLTILENAVNRSHPVQKGESLFRIGDTLNSIFAIRSGSAKLVRTTESGEEQILGFYLPGELLGLDAIESNQHQCTAVALETMSYCSIPFTRLEEICQFVPGLQHQMFRLMSKELCSENEILLSISNKKADERLASFIMNISQRFHGLGYSGKQFTLAMSRQDIANYLGLTIETVSRIIGRFQNNHIVSTNRKQIMIEDREKLEQLCVGS